MEQEGGAVSRARINCSVVFGSVPHESGHGPFRRLTLGFLALALGRIFGIFGVAKVFGRFRGSSAGQPFTTRTGTAGTFDNCFYFGRFKTFVFLSLDDYESVKLQDDDQSVLAGEENVHVADDLVVEDQQ